MRVIWGVQGPHSSCIRCWSTSRRQWGRASWDRTTPTKCPLHSLPPNYRRRQSASACHLSGNSCNDCQLLCRVGVVVMVRHGNNRVGHLIYAALTPNSVWHLPLLWPITLFAVLIDCQVQFKCDIGFCIIVEVDH